MAEQTSKYEVVFLARQDVSKAQVETITTEFAAIIKKNGGKVATTEQWGLRTLAYPINKATKAHYVLFQLEAPGTLIAELERQFRLHDDVVRYMTLKIEAFSEGPSVAMKDAA